MKEPRRLVRSRAKLALRGRRATWLELVLHMAILEEVEEMRASTSFGSRLNDERQPLLVEHIGHAKGSACASRAHSY